VRPAIYEDRYLSRHGVIWYELVADVAAPLDEVLQGCYVRVVAGTLYEYDVATIASQPTPLAPLPWKVRYGRPEDKLR